MPGDCTKEAPTLATKTMNRAAQRMANGLTCARKFEIVRLRELYRECVHYTLSGA